MDDPEPVDPLDPQAAEAGQARRAKRYFFDVDDGGRTVEDGSGMTIGDVGTIPKEAYNVLRDLLHHTLPDGQRTMRVRVRDEGGTVVYVGEMTVTGRRSRR